ncbi:MAG TPA: FAD-binding protein [Trebonia sp.]|jgi:electron transfer flavoprotein alpha subunit
MTVFCLVELDGEAVADPSLRALTLARALAAARGDAGLTAVLFVDRGGDDRARVDLSGGAGLGAYGVTDLYAVSGIPGYAPQAQGRVLAGLAGPGRVLIAAGTEHGNEVMAHAAAVAGLPMAANCTAAEPAAGSAAALAVTRQRWAGLLLEEAVVDAAAALLTVATEAVTAVPADQPAALTVRVLAATPDEADLVVRAVGTPAGAGGASLASARVVVGGGRGVGSADGFAPLEELARLLGGVVGVSRVVTSEGWRPHSMQVGQTGTKITPDLYLACGISGAIQHFAGCAGAKHIIAINTDPGAPMMTRADYAVVGDLHAVLPALIKSLRDRAPED